jgi:cation diffusion facilitator family transporter
MATPVRIQRLIAIVSVVLMAVKLLAWYLTHSVALLTDALESIANVIAGFVGLYTITLAARPRDNNHPYGHGKAEFVSAAIEGTLIIVAGGVILYESVRHLLHPKPLEQLGMGLLLSVGAGIIHFALGTYAVRIATRERSATLEAAGKHLQTDAWSTFAVTIGLGLVLLTGWLWIDSVAALILGASILRTGYTVIRKSLAGIMDETNQKLANDVIELVQQNRQPQWIDLHNFRVIQFGSNLHIDAHLTIPWYYQVIDADKEIHALQNLIQNHLGNKVEVFIHIDACMPFQCRLCSVAPCPARQEPFTQEVLWTAESVWNDARHGKNEHYNPDSYPSSTSH